MLSFISDIAGESKSGSGGIPDEPNVHLVVSCMQALGLTAQPPKDGVRHTESEEEDAEEITSFVVVRYGGQEYRTSVKEHTRRPIWNSSFTFREVEGETKIVFLFYTVDSVTGMQHLFGHIVLDINDPENPLPDNFPWINKEPIPIRGCQGGSFQMGAEDFPATWPDKPPILPDPVDEKKEESSSMDPFGLLGSSAPPPRWKAGKAVLSVTRLACNELGDILSAHNIVNKEIASLQETLYKTQGYMAKMMEHMGSLSAGAKEHFGALAVNDEGVADSKFALQLAAVAETEVRKLVGSLLQVNHDRDELLSEKHEKTNKIDDLQGSVSSLFSDLKEQTEGRHRAEATVAEQTSKIEDLELQLGDLNVLIEDMSRGREELLAEKSKLLDTNKFLLQKGLELAGSASVGTAAPSVGFAAFSEGSANAEDFTANFVASGDLRSEYDSTALALRRVAMGNAALSEYIAGSGTYSKEDIDRILKENMNGTMRYLKGEYVRLDPKEMDNLTKGITFTATLASSKKDESIYLQNFRKAFNGIKTYAVKLVFGNANRPASDFEDATGRWYAFTDGHLKPVTERHSKEAIKSLKNMLAHYDNLTVEQQEELFFEKQIVRNLEWIIKISATALSDGPYGSAGAGKFLRRKSSLRKLGSGTGFVPMPPEEQAGTSPNSAKRKQPLARKGSGSKNPDSGSRDRSRSKSRERERGKAT